LIHESKFLNDEERENFGIQLKLLEKGYLHELDQKIDDYEIDFHTKKVLALRKQNFGYKHLKNRFIVPYNKIQSRYYRKPSKSKDHSLDIMYNFDFNHPSLPITVNKTQHRTDNISYKTFVKLPDLNFSAKMLSEDAKTYTQAIINAFSLNASINYAKNHKLDYSKYFDNDKSTLPCPKANQNCVIRLKFKPLPAISGNMISRSELELNKINIKYRSDGENKKAGLLDYLLDKNVIISHSKKSFEIIEEAMFDECFVTYIIRSMLRFIDCNR